MDMFEKTLRKIGEAFGFSDEKQKEDNLDGEQTDVKFEDVKDSEGRTLRIEPSVAVDSTVQEISEDGTLIDVTDGDITLTDGVVISVASNVITAVDESNKETEEDTNTETEFTKKKVFAKTAIKSDKGHDVAKTTDVKFGKISEVYIYEYDVDQDTFEVGTILTTTYVYDEESYTYTVSSGEKVLEDGTKIQVDSEGMIVMSTAVDGTITTIEPVKETEPVVEPTTLSKEENDNKFNAIASTMDQAFETLKKENAEFKNELAILRDAVSKFAKLPAAKPTNIVVPGVNSFSDVKNKVSVKDMSAEEKLKAYGF